MPRVHAQETSLAVGDKVTLTPAPVEPRKLRAP